MSPLNSSGPGPATPWRLSDHLLLAQTVHHLNRSPPDWHAVSKMMLAHPLVCHPRRLKSFQEEEGLEGVVGKEGVVGREEGEALLLFFGAGQCEAVWTGLMRRYGLVGSLELDHDDDDHDEEHKGEEQEEEEEKVEKEEKVIQIEPSNNPTLKPTSHKLQPLSSSSSSSTSPSPPSSPSPPPPPRLDRKSQLTLAQILYVERMEQLREEIRGKEEEFRRLVRRLEMLTSSSSSGGGGGEG